jgi:hypothetical protein
MRCQCGGAEHLLGVWHQAGVDLLHLSGALRSRSEVVLTQPQKRPCDAGAQRSGTADTAEVSDACSEHICC